MLKRVLAAMTAALLLACGDARAAILDLTTAGSSGSVVGPGVDFFTTNLQQPTGSGVIHSFVRVQSNQDIVQGYNTGARPLQFDENNSPTFTRSLLLSDVPVVIIDGVAYRQFLLDINQQSSDPLLSLNELQLFVGNTGSPTGATVGANGRLNFGSQATLIYDLDSGPMGDSTIELDYNLNSGSGSGDIFAYIADSLFTGGTYVTLYSKFGSPNNNNDGYEEWAVVGEGGVRITAVPEPTTVVLALTGLAGVGLAGLRRIRRQTATA